MNKSLMARWRGNFLAGLGIVLPAVLSIAVVVWLFRNVSTFTDTLLFFLPNSWTHERTGEGPMWYWSAFALLLAVFLIGLTGQLARNYLGRRMIEVVDFTMLKVPLLNKIYSTIKQVNDAFSSSNKSSFKQVVLIEFPQAEQYAVGFITGAEHHQLPWKTPAHLVAVFVPTTPNPTSGFLVLVPESKVTKLEMSVAEGIKFIISLGAITPETGRATSPDSHYSLFHKPGSAG